MTIFDRIIIEANKYTETTGEYPCGICLGKLDVEELKSIVSVQCNAVNEVTGIGVTVLGLEVLQTLTDRCCAAVGRIKV